MQRFQARRMLWAWRERGREYKQTCRLLWRLASEGGASRKATEQLKQLRDMLTAQPIFDRRKVSPARALPADETRAPPAGTDDVTRARHRHA